MFFKKKKDSTRAVVITDQNFQEIVLDSEQGVLIDFWASWCGPCKVLGPIVDEIADDFKDKPVVIGKVNVDSNPQLSEAFGIKSIPTIVFMKKKKMLEKISGLVPKPNLEEMVNDLIAYTFVDEEE